MNSTYIAKRDPKEGWVEEAMGRMAAEGIVPVNIKNEILAKGGRDDSEKTRFDLLEPYALEQLAKVFTFGARKYADNNWLDRPMAWSRILASLHRHLNKFQQGEEIDPETGLSHAAHIAWNAMALVSYAKHCPEKDDRRKVTNEPE